MGFFARLRNTVLRRDSVSSDAGEEIRFHIEERAREYMAEGIPPAEARRKAELRFGGAFRMREETRDADVLVSLDAWIRDAWIALRGVRRRPLMAGAVIGSLALGIGLNTAVFSVVNHWLLKPLPFPRSSEVWMLRESLDGSPVGGNPARFRDWREQSRSFEAFAGFYQESVVLTGRGDPERLTILRTFGSPLALLAARPVLGRGFTRQEEEDGAGGAVLVTHRFWQSRLGGSENAIGQPLALSNKPYRVVGVLPGDLGYPEGVDLIAPAEPEFQKADRTGNWFSVVARLRTGVDPRQAQAELDGIASRLAAAHPGTDRNLRVRPQPLHRVAREGAAERALLAMGAVAFVLAIACLNIAGLLLARACERSRETAIRASLGASRWPIARLFLLEGAWLAIPGGALGLALSFWGVAWMRWAKIGGVPAETAIDGTVLAFTAAATLVCALGIAVLPARQGLTQTSSALLKESRAMTGSRDRQRVRTVLACAQSALSVVLLAGAFLALRGVAEIARSPLGFDPAHRIAVAVHLPWGTGAGELREFERRAIEELSAIPSVRRVGFADAVPLTGETQSGPIEIKGVDIPPQLRSQPVDRRTVSAGYFAAVGQPLIAGRLFEDRPGPVEEVAVNQAFAATYMKGASPIGAEIALDVEGPRRFAKVTGVVGDVRRTLFDAAPHPAIYRSYAHAYWPMGEFILDTGMAPARIGESAREAIRRVDPNLPINAIQTLDSSLSRSLQWPRTQAALLGAFALGAVSLAALGLYGLLASDVAQRRREIGVRLALGAEPRRLVGMFTLRAVRIAAIGLAAGSAGALALSRILAGAIPGFPAADWTAPAAAGAFSLVASLLASLIPATRAARVDPAVTLRSE